MTRDGGDGGGLAWWEAQFSPRAATDALSFRGAFFPALLRVCEAQELPPELSMDELRVLVRFCLGDAARRDDTVPKQDFLWFLARFGPLEQSIHKLVANFCVSREMAPWFHGSMGRRAAERALASPGRDDGAFLVRFSESQPTKFTLSYLKVHAESGRREVKNCLVENRGRAGGYTLLEGSQSRHQRTYTSLQTFVKHNASRLKLGVPSELARACNYELADLRAVCDHQSGAYTAFSSETVVDAQDAQTDDSGYSASMLFTRSPVLRAQMEYQQYGLQIPPEGADNTSCCADSYASFSLDALSSIPSNQNMYLPPGTASKRDNSQSSTSQESDYGSFSAFADMASSSKSNFFAAANSASFSSASDGYGNFDAFAAAARFPADESRELAARQAQFVSLSRSPTRPKTQGWGTEDQHDEDSVYGSFASANVTSPSTPVLPVTIKALSSSSMSANSSSDYGSFASMASSESFDAFSTGSSSESTLPQWTAALGPPPSPPRSILLRPSPSKAPQPDDVYGSFSSLTIADHRESPSDNESMMSSTVSLPNLLTSDDTSRSSSDSGDETKSAPATTITDISASTPSLSLSHPPQGSALEELNAGMTFYKQKQLDEAILRFVVAREIARETGDKVVEARALGNLGTVYLDRKSARQAVECYEKCLEITRSIGDTKRERTILNNLVLAFVACDEFAEALAFCQVQLEMTSNDINRRKILSRMSLLRERMTRAATVKREVEASAAFA